MRILIIEDEKQLAANIKSFLLKKGDAVDLAVTGEEGAYLAENEPYDVVILDLMLPDKDGLKICQSLRQKEVKTPILMLTARVAVEERVAGLNAGADDYLTKPFALTELQARLEALIRRNQSEGKTILKIDKLELNPASHTVSLDKKSLLLTPKEFAILEMLMRRPGQVVTRSMIMEHVWDYNFESLSNVVDVFVNTLRKKIGKDVIKTVHGVGYKIE
ncbi:DNA-binding response regulator [Candidatus Shapirobacteria bacterium CG09_land_8_20_14_0_10_47_13]|uniref:DNA-binding response regulator n=1 Tax=Candidatus Shapirobacteria bacterium CG09_land_8_20_14_0_10_47_13 TaxID=1974481 RepID=A0A2H0WQK0_9BACT|nr:MAG: DNA-binding response regulator [Candidatus Shapirobacteria bacterium CG09_land_8_20_14_0_10_47_13]